MKFDLSWFTTIPGILITCGVVLLIIALVIFIVTSRKNKKLDSNKVENTDNSVNVQNTQNDNIQAVTPVEIDNAPLQDINNVPSNDAAVPIELPAEPIPVVEQPQPEPISVNPEPIAVPTPVIEETPVVTNPTPSAINTTVPEPIPVVSTPEVVPAVQPEAIPTPQPEVIPVVNPVETPVQEKPSIYGGVSEIIPNINLNQKTESHQIYGGADPLENTQTLTITPNNSVVASVEPVVTEQQPQVTIPTIDNTPSTQAQPVVNVIPSVEEVTQQNNGQSDIDSLMP